MIEDPPLLTVRRNFPRPNAEQIAAFTGAQSGHVIDAMNGRGGLDHTIKPVDPETASFCGVAVPCWAGPNDQLAIYAALDAAQPGDVILCASEGYVGSAIVGDMLTGMMRNGGMVGFVTDGAVRDTVGIIDVGLPCFAAAVTPNSCARNGPGTAGLPINMGDVQVSAGDIIVADIDGVVVVPFARIDDTIGQLANVRAAEATLEAKVKGGLVVPEFVTELLKSGRVKQVD